MESIPGLLAALEEESDKEKARHRDLCLILRKYQSSETLLCAGGRWDSAERQWSRQEPEKAHVIDIGPGQEPFIRWAARFLRDYRNGHEVPAYVRELRTRVVLAESGRRSGKTHALQAFQWAMAVDIPLIHGKALVCWAIHVSHQEEEEYFDNLKGERKIVPSSWYRWKARPQRFELVHGSYVQMISSDNERTTKRGKVDIAFINEAQKQRQPVLTNMIYGVADRGGLAILAANPNDTLVGEWVAKFKESIAAGEMPHAESFYFDPALNPFIDQQARSDVDDIVKLIDPKAARREGGGEWLPVGDRTYYDFRKRATKNQFEERASCVAPVPDIGLPDITREVTRKRLGRAYDYVAGHDPNGKPHMAGVIGKFFGKVEDPILWIIEELIVEGHEDEFLDYVSDQGYRTDNTHWIIDGSSFWQGTERKIGVYTSDFFKARGWVARGPEDKKSSKGLYAANPRPAARRYGRTNHLLKGGKTMISPERCEWLIESLAECLWRRTPSGGIAIGKHTHVTDALGYLQWFWFPRPKAPPKPMTTYYEAIPR